MGFADTMVLKIKVHLSFTAPVTSVFVCLRLEDEEVLTEDTDILEITLAGMEGRQRDELKVDINSRCTTPESDYQVYLEIFELDFF